MIYIHDIIYNMILKIKQKHNQCPNYCCKLTGETKFDECQ